MNNELGRYGVSGVAAFLADFSVLYACTEHLDMHYLVSNIFGYGAGLLVSYLLNTRWVFSYRRISRTWLELLIFNGIVLAGLLVNELMMVALVAGVSLHYLQAKVCAAGVVTVLNYFAKKYILFSPRASRELAP